MTEQQVDDWIKSKPVTDPKSVDSILIWVEVLEKIGAEISYERCNSHADRFRAFYHDYKGDIASSIDYSLKFLGSARAANHQMDINTAISDLVYIYVTIGQYDKAKTLLVNVIEDAKSNEQDPKQLSSFYNNLGIIYKRAEQLDSAAWAYNKSRVIKESIGDTKGLLDLKINLSSLYEKLGEYDKTVQLSRENLTAIGPEGSAQDIIHNMNNLAAGLLGKRNYKEAEEYLLIADSIATSLDNAQLQDQTSNTLSLFYNQIGQHEKAYEQLLKSTTIRSKVLNEEANIQIASLREAYEAEKRELENKQLTADLEVSNHQIRLFIAGLSSLLIVTTIIIWFWSANRKKNKLLAEQNNQINLQNEKLKQLNRDKNNLMSLVSHDLSGPFTAIKVWAQSLSFKSSSESIDETRQALVNISDEALQSIDRALSIDKDQLHKLELAQINLKDLLNEATSEEVVIGKEKNIKVNINYDSADISITTDASILKRIMRNLVSNAIKFSHPDSQINIHTRATDDMIILAVQDHGVGISKEDQKSIFERFDQGSSSPTSGEQSHGLGLAIVKRLVEELGGIITVKSEVDKGSTFTVRLPR